MQIAEPELCNWPFHHEPGCKECAEWDKTHSQALEDYLVSLEIRQAARRAERAARRKTMQAGASAPEPPASA